jgi:hypothetical protein
MGSSAVMLAVAAALAFSAGWRIHAWKSDATIGALKADFAQAQAKATSEADSKRAADQRKANDAAAEVERLLAEARKRDALVRGSADRVRQLTEQLSRGAAPGGETCQRERERIRGLAGLVSEGAGLLGEGVELVGRLDARLSGCQAAP